MPYSYHINKKSWGSFLVEELIFKSWGVVILLLLSFIIYDQAIEQKEDEIIELNQKIDKLKSERKVLLSMEEDLKLQINSQSDYGWIELTLMNGLGLVPEGQTKVYFAKKEEP